MTDIPRPSSIHDDIDQLVEEVTSLHRSLAKKGAEVSVADPAVAWVTESAVSGRVLPVNQATATALTSAAEALRTQAAHS